MKKVLSFALALAMMLSLAACAPKKTAKTPEELKVLYTESINGARDAETNEYLPCITAKEDQFADVILPMVTVSDDNSSAYAVAISPMNMQAYGIAAVMPLEGKEDDVKAGLQGFIDLQKQNFEQYLPDQKEIANAAKLEVLADGTVLLVMCEDQDTVFAAIKAAIEK
ncbi:MAG: DUF4358 domain-containing protein [Oscillospiraceae bacterium]